MDKDLHGSMEMGAQPLDGIISALGFSHSDLVKASTDQLTHKMVAKARKGRRVSLNIQKKICKALNTCQKARVYGLSDLFNYGADTSKKKPN